MSMFGENALTEEVISITKKKKLKETLTNMCETMLLLVLKKPCVIGRMTLY